MTTLAARAAPLGRDSGIPYNPALDGLRGLALVVVCCGHLATALVPGGLFALDVFFALSGYFVTRLLLNEHGRRGRLDLRTFYLRRALRVLPPLVVIAALTVVLADIAPDRVPGAGALSSVGWALSYVCNWYVAHSYPHRAGYLTHTWTVSIEEQFWFVWPSVLLLMLRRRWAIRHLLAVTLALAATSWAVRAALFHERGVPLAFFSTPARADGLMVGAATAVILGAPGARLHAARMCRGLAGPALVVLVVGVLTAHSTDGWPYYWGIAVVVLLSAVLIIDLGNRPTSVPSRALSTRGLAWMGRASYSFYLVNFPIAVVLYERTHLGDAARLLVGGFLTAALGPLLYWTVETPALKLRQRISPSRLT